MGISHRRKANPGRIQQVPIDRLTAHPYAERVPRMNSELSELLSNDIKSAGIQVPLVVTDTGLVLDGVTRWRLARERHVKTVPVVVKAGLSDDEQIAYVERANLRRDLSEGQRALWAAADILPRVKAAESESERRSRSQRRRRQRERGQESENGHLSPGEGAPRNAAAIAGQRAGGVSAQRVFEALDVLEADPELAEEVKAGICTLGRALARLKRDRDADKLNAQRKNKRDRDRWLAEALHGWAKKDKDWKTVNDLSRAAWARFGRAAAQLVAARDRTFD